MGNNRWLRRWRRQLLRGASGCLALVAIAVIARAQAAPAPAAAKPEPGRCLVGLYVTSIGDFNFAAQTYRADLWIWTHTDPARKLRPLRTMEFTNAVTTTSALASTEDKDGVRWSQCKLSGTFRHHWDLRNFPFDRHTLRVTLEEGMADTSALVYVPDTRNSSFLRSMAPDDWAITGFQVIAKPVAHLSTFGDPGLRPGSGSVYAGLQADITIQRKELTSYFKLTAIAYVSFLLMLISCFIHMDAHDLGLAALNTRVTLLAGALFACVISMRSISSTLGSEDGITLIDKVHTLVLAHILLAAALTVLGRYRLGQGRTGTQIQRQDLWTAGLATTTFLVLNGALLLQASR